MNETGIDETGLTRGNTPDIKDSKVAINDKEPEIVCSNILKTEELYPTIIIFEQNHSIELL